MTDTESDPDSDGSGADREDRSVGDDALIDALEQELFGAPPTMTQGEVTERAGVSLELARELWHQLGFAHAEPDEVAFTEADAHALRLTKDLIDLGLLSEERQEGLVRTWGRSFARLAEWQAAQLADLARESGVPLKDALAFLSKEALPKVEELQSYTWRRHLLSAGGRLLANTDDAQRAGVCFVDIVGYTSRSRTLSESELVDWLESFEKAALTTVVERRGRIIKNIGDELLIVADSAEDIAEIALELVARGEDDDDPFPAVRAGVAYGEVVSRLGDVYGPVVNIASRLTTVARPCTVVIDREMHSALSGRPVATDDESDTSRDDERHETEGAAYRFRRLRRVSVKGYSRLMVWALSRA